MAVDTTETMPAKDRIVKLTVKPNDEDCLRWLEAQERASASLRVLIAEDIKQHGYTDAFWRIAKQGVNADD